MTTATTCKLPYVVWKLSRGGLRQDLLETGFLDVPTNRWGLIEPGVTRPLGQKLFDECAPVYGRIELVVFKQFVPLQVREGEDWDLYHHVAAQYYPENKIPRW